MICRFCGARLVVPRPPKCRAGCVAIINKRVIATCRKCGNSTSVSVPLSRKEARAHLRAELGL